jgi:hypothetical protein
MDLWLRADFRDLRDCRNSAVWLSEAFLAEIAEVFWLFGDRLLEAE